MNAYIYIDECGTASLNIEKSGVMPYLVYSAVIIEEKDLSLARQTLQETIKKCNIQQGYIKSQNLKYDKRIQVLRHFKTFNHYVYCLVIDKAKIDANSGLQYKQSFIKFFQRLLSKHFQQRYDEFHITFDKLGWPEFQQSLKKYMKDHGLIDQTLFSNNSFDLADDIKEEPLLQLADVYAGTINKYYCQSCNKNEANHIHDNFLRGKLTIEWFPWESVTLVAAQNLFNEEFDKKLYEISIDTANRYITSYSQDDPEGVEIIKYLLQESAKNPLRVISSKEIKRNLQERGYEIGDPISKISSLRSKEVVIISPQGKKGYKFPTSEKELADFYDRLRKNVIPQLIRCRILNSVLQEKSYGNYGVLKHEEYSILNQLCEIVNKESI